MPKRLVHRDALHDLAYPYDEEEDFFMLRIALEKDQIDEVIKIANETAFVTARLVARLEGVPVGISSGAALAAGIEVGKRPEMAGKMIVVVLPSFAERYLSTALFEGIGAD